MVCFSVVIPLFNKKEKISIALDSINFQTVQDFEVVIVDDGSRDGSKEIVKQWILTNAVEKNKYRLVTQSNEGVSSARNLGVKESKFDYIAFLDADDYWKKDHLYSLKLLIEEFSGKVDMFSTGVMQFQDGQEVFPALKGYENFIGVVDFFKVSMISNGFINSSSVCVKKKVIQCVSFPVGMVNYEDVITWARISGSIGFAFCSNRSAVYVIDNADASLNVEFDSFINFNELLDLVDCDDKLIYKIKFFGLHLLFCKMNMSFKEYFRAGRYITGFNIVILIFVAALFVPKFVLKGLRNKRKKVK